jgi:hypothetical protein
MCVALGVNVLCVIRDILFGSGNFMSKISVTVRRVSLLDSRVYLSNRATCFDFKLA